MHRISLFLVGCIASCALAIGSAPAAVRASVAAAPVIVFSTASDSPAPALNSTSTSRRHGRALTHAARKARKEKKIVSARAPATERVIVHEMPTKGFAAAQKAEQAESNARAERLYRASQFSAPILIDAKACKRVDANGEPIYENC